MVLLCLCQPVVMDASVPYTSFAWQTPKQGKQTQLCGLLDTIGNKSLINWFNSQTHIVIHIISNNLMIKLIRILFQRFLCSPLLQRFPAQHMESLAQRFRLLRQGRHAPRASLQNSSPPQSSSSVQTADCCSVRRRKTKSAWQKICCRYDRRCHRGAQTWLLRTGVNYLQGVYG